MIKVVSSYLLSHLRCFCSQTLKRHWLNPFIMPWNQPIDQIKEYFGEKVRC